MMTRASLESQVRELYAEAFTADLIHIEEATRAITGGDVFVWSRLSVAQLFQLRHVCFSTVLRARG